MPLPELFCDDVFHVETPRLWLRWPRAADARALHRFASLAEVAERTATWPHPLPEHEAERRILKAREANAAGRALVLAITRKREPERLVGLVGLREESDTALGAGFMLDPEIQRRGFMTEALGAALGAVFAFGPHNVVRGACMVGNRASRRVFEKLGFEHVGDSVHAAPARPGPLPCHDFELSKATWRERGAERRRALSEVGPKGGEARAA